MKRNILKYLDVFLTIGQNTAVITHVSVNNGNWQTYVGTEIGNLKEDILEKLYIQQITTQMSYENGGVFPVLVIYASDKVELIEFKFPFGMKNNKEKDNDEED